MSLITKWEYSKLKNHIKIIKGKKPSNVFEYETDACVPYLLASSIRSKSNNYWAEKESKLEYVKKDDVVIIWDGSNSGEVFTDIEGILASTMAKLIPDKKMLSFFLYNYLTTKFIILNTRTSGSAIPHISRSVLENLQVPVPPLVEQRGIVEVLGTVDECKGLTDAVIERAKELKQGLMQQLLTRGIKHTEYKETPLGEIPKSWRISTFGEECTIGTGGTPRRNQSDYYLGNIPWVKSTELDYGIIFETEEHISQRALEESNAKIFPTGTLLIAMYGLEAIGTRGRCAILGIDAATNQAIAAIQPKKKILPRFLYYYYQQMGNRIMKHAEGTKRKNLSLSIMKKIPIIVPSIHEQRKIVDIIQNQDEILKLESQKLNQLAQLKQGFMQQLFSGKVRVELKGDGLHRIGDGREAHH